MNLPIPAAGAAPADQIALAVCQAVADMDDRNSPEGQPEMMLVTSKELFDIVRDAIANQGTAVPLADSRAGRVYLAGPMTGYEDWNFPTFNAAAAKLRAGGMDVVNPAEHGIVPGAEWGDYLRYDIAKLSDCASVALLPGWSKSKGATLEVHIARALGMPIDYLDGAERAATSPDSGAAPKHDWVRSNLNYIAAYDIDEALPFEKLKSRLRSIITRARSTLATAAPDAPARETDAVPAASGMVIDLAPPEVTTKLFMLQSGGCTCNTKTPELRFHREDCTYRLAVEVQDLLNSTTAAAPIEDALRMDWLALQVVNVRYPLRYGSKEGFIASPDDSDGETLPSHLRKQIDERMGAERARKHPNV